MRTVIGTWLNIDSDLMLTNSEMIIKNVVNGRMLYILNHTVRAHSLINYQCSV